MKHAANAKAWALGCGQRNGFHVRKVVWGLTMARAERRFGESIRAATITVGPARKGEQPPKPRPRKPELFLPSRLVAEGVAIPEGWVLDPTRDGLIPPPPTADATVPCSDAAVKVEREP